MADASDIARREQYIESALERIAELERELELERAAHTVCARSRAEAEDRAIRLAEENAELQAKIDGQLRRDTK